MPDLAQAIQRGDALSDQLRRYGESDLAVALIAAGEKSGHLPEMCERLVDYYENAIKTRNTIIGKAIYPDLAFMSRPSLRRLSCPSWAIGHRPGPCLARRCSGSA